MTDWKQEAIQSLIEQRRRPGDLPSLDLCEEDLVQEGFAQDFVQTYVRDFVRGAARMARRLAKNALHARFGGVPEGVMARLEAIREPEVLQRLAEAAAWRAKSLEDFVALVPDGAHG